MFGCWLSGTVDVDLDVGQEFGNEIVVFAGRVGVEVGSESGQKIYPVVGGEDCQVDDTGAPGALLLL